MRGLAELGSDRRCACFPFHCADAEKFDDRECSCHCHCAMMHVLWKGQLGQSC